MQNSVKTSNRGNIKMSIIQKLANPAPLGLLGFGLTTVLLNLHNAGVFPLDTMILAMGIAFGGLAQIIVGIMEYQKRQHLWHSSFQFLRLLLVVTCPSACSAKTNLHIAWIRCTKRRIDGSILLHVGHIYFRNVLWHTKSKPRTTIRIRKLSNTVLYADNTRTTWKPSLVQHNHRNRRRHMRRKRSLPWTCRSLKRSKPKNSPANPSSKIINNLHFLFFIFYLFHSTFDAYSKKSSYHVYVKSGLILFYFKILVEKTYIL